jgi:transcriptional regulator with XRE-family HTH domain
LFKKGLIVFLGHRYSFQVMNHQTVVDILQTELTRRCQHNPRYSLRAFARLLGVSPANLSLVLNRKRPPSQKTVDRILNRIALDPLQKELMSQSTASVQPDLQDNIATETVEKMATWLAYAMLSLIKTKDFKPDLRWIASRLGVSVFEVKSTAEALRTVGLLQVTKDGWKRKTEGLRLKNPVSTAISQNFQRQLLAKAQQSMENDPMESRDLTSITMAMSPEKMKQAKEEIRKFRLKMAELFEEPGKSTEVYNLTVQFVPVTTKNKNTKDVPK